MIRLCALTLFALLLPAQTFEVASIREVQPPFSRMATHTVSGTRIKFEAYAVLELVAEAYHVRLDQIATAPAFARGVREPRYTIDARVAGEKAPTRNEIRKMLESLLSDRFKLVIRREPKEMEVYALAAAKGGALLKPSTLDTPCAVQIQNRETVYVRTFANCGMETLVDSVGEQTGDRPVVDKTGLKGSYDFRLTATPDFLRHRVLELDVVDIHKALRELGLKLDSQKDLVNILVIAQAEKPTEN